MVASLGRGKSAMLLVAGAATVLVLLSAPAEARLVSVGSTSAHVSPDGTGWDPAMPNIPQNLRRITHGNGLFTAVGSAGAIYTSPDGEAWTLRPTGTTAQFNGIAYGDLGGTPMFVAVGAYNRTPQLPRGPSPAPAPPAPVSTVQVAYTSPDGITWTQRPMPLYYTITQYGIAYGTVLGAGRMVSVGLDATALVSLDGTSWSVHHTGASTQTSSATATLYSVAFGNGEFIAVGASGKMVASPDGMTWLNRTSGTTSTLYDIAYDNGLWVAVGTGRTILTSADGVTWTRSPTPAGLTNSVTFQGIAHGNGRWVAVSSSGSSPNSTTYSSAVLVSDTGAASWELRPATAYYSYGPMSLVHAQGRWVAVGNGAILRSDDGDEWLAGSMRVLYTQYGVAHEGGLWVSVGYYGSAFTSPDGFNWTRQHTGIGCCNHLNAVAYGAGKWVAVGNAGIIITSPDGRNWSPSMSGTSQALYGVAFRAGQWLAVGGSGITVTSPDGVTWTSRGSSTGQTLRAVAWGNGNWTAVGTSGVVIGSADGLTWASRSSPTASSLYGVAYDGQAPAAKWVAVGTSGVSIASPNGVNWATVPTGTTQQLYATVSDGRWVGVGNLVGIHSPSASAGSWTTTPMAGTPMAVASDKPQPLSCLPARLVVGIGQPARVGGGGGQWPYTWNAIGSNLPVPVAGSGIAPAYAALGTYYVTLTDSATPAASVSCQVDVVANPPPPPAPPVTACGYIVRDSTTDPGLYDFQDIDPAVGGGGTGIPNHWYYTTYAVRPTPATPFNFRFCGSTYQTFWLSAAGYICMGPTNVATGTTFGAPTGCTNYYSATTLPNSATPNGVVVGLWNILNPALCSGGSTRCSFYKVEGPVGDRVLTYEFKDVPIYYATNGQKQTFQIKLFEASGCIEAHYRSVAFEPRYPWYPNVAGFENAAGTSGYTYAYGSASVGITKSDSAWRACPFTAMPDSYAFNEDQEAQEFDVTANDITGGVAHTVTLATPPAKGVVTGPVNGRFTYQPLLDLNGADSFTYTIRDPVGGRVSTGTVSLTINPVNDAPSFAFPAAPVALALTEDVRDLPGWATAVQPGPATAADEAGQVVSFELVSDSNPALFRAPPTLRRTATAVATSPVDPPTSGAFAVLHLEPVAAGQGTLCFRARDSGGVGPSFTANLDPLSWADGVDASPLACVTVAVNGPPVAYFEASAPAASPGQDLTLDACPRPLPACSHDADGRIVDYSWTFGDGTTARGPSVLHAFASPGAFTVRLTVTDDEGLTGTAERTLRIAWPDAAAVADTGAGSATAPIADAGADLTVPAGTRAVLHGEALGSHSATFQWRQAGGPAVALDGELTPGPSFAAPAIADGRPVQLAFALVVSDGALASAPDHVVVTVVPAPPSLLADAGGQSVATVGEPVRLQAGSVGGAGPVTYAWSQAEGPAVDLLGAGSDVASFTAPAEPAVLRFRLTASDGAATSHDEMVVYVLAAEAPVEGAGAASGQETAGSAVKARPAPATASALWFVAAALVLAGVAAAVALAVVRRAK